ncbi:MAG: FIST C-terminal domain-containing protein [Synergistaceae bacterium]|jgi:hypothetical protein|nr:FIST C-terminal domain-containing protein [Synergistaceae bacterium]
MRSAVAVSYELEDGREAAEELTASIREKLELGKNSIGFLMCDADTDGAALTRELKNLLGIETAGMTSRAPLGPDGCCESAAVLLVLTADDCSFSAAVSEPIADGRHEEKIRAFCETVVPAAARKQGQGIREQGILFAFCPSNMPFSGDVYPNALSEAAPGVPVIGGACSDDYDYARARVFLSGREFRDSLVGAGVWGNVKPVFSLRHVTSRFTERIRRVTAAEGNVVRRVGDETFVEYLESFGLKTDVPDPLMAFTSYPMMLTRESGDEIPLMRHILTLNHADGSGSFFGDVPAGSLANMCLISRDDIKAACRESMAALLEEAAKNEDYEYSAIFCASCCGRAIILGADSGAEGAILAEMLPANLSLAGGYCLGEICPARYRDGLVSNRFHNCSIAFCMF